MCYCLPVYGLQQSGIVLVSFFFGGVWGLRQRGCPLAGQDPKGPSRTPNPALAAQLAESLLVTAIAISIASSGSLLLIDARYHHPS